MSENLVSIELNNEALEKIQEAIKVINNNLPDLISISKEEKTSICKTKPSNHSGFS